MTIDDVTLAEGDSGTTNFDFTVTLSAAVDTPLTVDFTTADSTATTSDSDYAANSGTLNFAGIAGETQKLTVSVTGDQAAEFDEAFILNLMNLATSGRQVIIADGQGLATITNDDDQLASITIGPLKDNTLIENASGAVSNGAGSIYVGQNGNGNLIRRGLLAFDIAGSVPTAQSFTVSH